MFGPGCTGFVFFMSIWGVIFLAILGGLYYNESIGLLEDIPKEDKNSTLTKTWSERVTDIQGKYKQNAYNAWIAAGAYGVLTVVCGIRLAVLLR